MVINIGGELAGQQEKANSSSVDATNRLVAIVTMLAMALLLALLQSVTVRQESMHWKGNSYEPSCDCDSQQSRCRSRCHEACAGSGRLQW